MKRASALVVGALLLAAPNAYAEEGDSPGSYPPASARPKLIVGGLAVTGFAYGTAVLTAQLASDLPGIDAMNIPVAGPWISLAQMECPADDPDCGFVLYLRGVLTVANGLMQLGGLGIAGEGLFLKTEAKDPSELRVQGVVMRPAPIVTASTLGVGVIGSF